ncbi:hypothetical protein LINPERHAP2_LOCUS26767 [Linum perenne]
MNLGPCAITREKLRGFVTKLQVAWERGYRRVHV